jgi:hypothetical protein
MGGGGVVWSGLAEANDSETETSLAIHNQGKTKSYFTPTGFGMKLVGMT